MSRADFVSAAFWAENADFWERLAVQWWAGTAYGQAAAHVATDCEFHCNVARNAESRALRGEP